jgi:hypothetical protein
MSTPDRKTLIVIAAALAAVAVGWFVYRSAETPAPEGPPRTRSEVPPGTVVPEEGATGLSGNVAVPDVVVAAAPQSANKFRNFNLKLEGDKIIPDTVAVNLGDVVHINLTAADKDYDIVQPDYGLNLSLRRGETRFLEFQAVAGDKFMMYCSRCGGPEKGPVGYIAVVSR